MSLLSTRFFNSALAGACRYAAAAVVAVTLMHGSALAQSARFKGPDSLADLAEGVTDAVVNISASSRPAANSESRPRSGPQLPPGTPFEEFFEEFFRRGPGGQAPNRPEQRRGNSLGSGFVIDSAGIVITNNHVIGEATDVTVIFNDGTRLKAEIVGKDTKIDIAVLRVKPEKPLKAVKFGDSEKMRIGDWVMAIGNPFGLGGSVSAGIVSARNRFIDSGPYDNYLQTDAAINKGNSGGPLFNMQGEVIGINTAILSPTGGSVGIGFAVPSALAIPVIDQLKEFGETRRGWLGVKIQGVDDTTADALGLGKARGALVAGVDDKGPAKTGGLEVGDVIVKFDGKDIRDSRDLPRLVAATRVDSTVDVVVMRKGKEVVRQVKIARLDEGSATKPASAVQSEPAASKKALGLELSAITDELRRRYSIKDTLKGVVVTSVDASSAAADKRIVAGTVILEVQQDAVSKPEDVTKRLDDLKKQGRKSALLTVASNDGETRLVALAIE